MTHTPARSRRRRLEQPRSSVGDGAGPSVPPDHDVGSLGLLATAIAQRPISVVAGTVETAHTDGVAIVVPSMAPRASLVRTVCIQAALISAGALDAPDLRRVLRNPESAGRFVALEASRAAVALADLLPEAVLTELSGVRVQAAPRSPAESAHLALHDRSITVAPDHFGSLRRPSGPALARALRRGARLDDDASEHEERAEEPDGSADAAAKSLILVAPPFQNPLAKLMQSLFGRGGSTEDDAGGSDIGVHSAVTPGDEPSAHARLVTGRAPRSSARPAEDCDVSYPEWDCRADSYRPRWVSVSLLDPASRADREPAHHRPDRRLLNAVLRVALSPERHDRQRAGDGLDVNALVDLHVARAHGDAPDERVYQARRRTMNDLSLLLLLDCSGSAAETTGSVPIWDRQRAVAGDLLAALAESGSRVAAYGFSSRARHVRFLRIKRFDDHFGHRARERLWALEPSGFTRMGGAIRHASSLLRRGADTDRRLLVVISDGLPYDDDYEGTYAEQDTRRALDEAASSGIGCACFAVDSPTDRDALDRLWGGATHVPISSDAPWLPRVEQALRSALRTSAAVHRPR